jgi:hypothetical protein
MIDLSSKNESSKLNTLIFNTLTFCLFFIASLMKVNLFSTFFQNFFDSTRLFQFHERNYSNSFFLIDDNYEKIVKFIAVITVEIIYLIIKWWLSDCLKIWFRFEFRDFKSRMKNQSINVLINLIRINDDDDFFTFSNIKKFFTSRFIVYILQDLIRVKTHLDKFMKISRFIRLDC